MAKLDLAYNVESLSEKYRVEKPFIQNEYLVDGEIRLWNGEIEEVYSPICSADGGRVFLGSYPNLDGNVAMQALDAAVRAYDNGQGEWAKMSVLDRIKCFKKFVLSMREQRDFIVKYLMWEICKSQKDAEKEFDRTIDYINDTVEALKDLDRVSSRFTIESGVIAQIKRAPLGVVLCMGPFNYPLNETFTTLIPALIMGNTVILKPPKLGVLLLYPFLRLFCDCFPKGVVNVVYGSGQKVITPIMESGKVNVLAFIGSSRVADLLKKEHPHPHKFKSVLGLDAKNPAIILADADINVAVSECLKGTLSFNGQRCTALKILFVHENIYDNFVVKFSKAVDDLKIGLPWTENVNITPLPEKDKNSYLMGLVDDALGKGAVKANASELVLNVSTFSPVVLSNVNSNMRVFHEEQFGPIVPIVKFSTINEPLEYVINSKYGQQASVFGYDCKEMSVLIDTLVNQVCRVNVNSQCQRGPDVFPFTGRKDSAEGTLSVSDALKVFSIRTLVAFNENDANKELLRGILKNNSSNFISTDFIL